METKKMQLSQNKLEFFIAVGFGAIIIASASTNVGYIPLGDGRYLDMAIIPAVFAAMIGGYRVGIPVAILWALLAFHNIGLNGQAITFYALLINKIVLVTVLYAAYKTCKKWFPYSPTNVHRALFLGITAKTIVGNVMLIRAAMHTGHFKMSEWLLHAAQQYVLELSLVSLAMMLLIKNLRQIHILNGVKRREKAIKVNSKPSKRHYQEG